MDTQNLIATISIVASVFVGIISWFVSAALTKKTLKKQKLNYEIKVFPVISQKFIKSKEFEVFFQDELLPEPTLLTVDIINAGNVAIKNPPIKVEAVGATYLIPGYFEDVPPGYDELWELERSDAEASIIKLKHINPGQVVKARFFLDELPNELPILSCPMEDLEVKEINSEMNQILIKGISESLVGITPFGRVILSTSAILRNKK